jgi:hypothetical protein
LVGQSSVDIMAFDDVRRASWIGALKYALA